MRFTVCVLVAFGQLFVPARVDGQTASLHVLPQAQPGSLYDTQLSIPPGLGYPFTCVLLGDPLPQGLGFSCDSLKLHGRIQTKSNKSYNLTLRLSDAAGNSKNFSLMLQVSSKPQVVNLVDPQPDFAKDEPEKTGRPVQSPAQVSSQATVVSQPEVGQFAVSSNAPVTDIKSEESPLTSASRPEVPGKAAAELQAAAAELMVAPASVRSTGASERIPSEYATLRISTPPLTEVASLLAPPPVITPQPGFADGQTAETGDLATDTANQATGANANNSTPPSFSAVSPLGMTVAGLDISGASSTSPKAVFLATGMMDLPLAKQGNMDFSQRYTSWFSGLLRVAGMAQPGTLSGNLGDLASTGTYLSSAINATPDQIVQSIEGGAAFAFQLGSWKPQVGTFDVGTPALSTKNFTGPFTALTMSVIGSVGAITPLSASQANPPVYYLTQQIMQTYNINPTGCSYTGNTPPCYVAFVPSDRTHFYRNYEAGFRLKIYGGDYASKTQQYQYRFPGMADITIGQNEYVTGGRLHGAVLHIGGAMPVPTADGVYIFGSMDLGVNFKYNQENPQLLLTPLPTPSTITYLSPSVNIIPVSQPNRDRYRLGFGVDIFHLITAVKTKGPAPH